MTIHLNHETLLPPVNCPLLIEVEGKLLEAVRESHVIQRGRDMTYVLENGEKLQGQFKWTYP